MKMGKTTALNSEYVIDGARMEFTPREILESASGIDSEIDGEEERSSRMVDESIDPSPVCGVFDKEMVAARIDGILGLRDSPRNISAACPGRISKAETAKAIINTLWKKGHFRIDDLTMEAFWEWNMEPVGNMAAFYSSVEAVCGYLDELGIRLSGYKIDETGGPCRISFTSGISNQEETDGDSDGQQDSGIVEAQIYEEPFKTANPKMEDGLKCPGKLSGENDNWLIYIPFDTCRFSLGGSLLSELSGIPGGNAPDIRDTDYFIDCYEVVREFVEDGIVLSGTTVGTGGLLAAMKSLASGRHGIDADIESLLHSYKEDDPVRLLLGEVPGVIIEIPSSDFDYIDAELLLQDVAYYPLGHPGPEGVRITRGASSSLSGILQSLIDVQTAEGED